MLGNLHTVQNQILISHIYEMFATSLVVHKVKGHYERK